jgi:hypothetical protein
MTAPDSHEEYRQASENMRAYANMRFAQLTLLSALAAGTLAAVYGQEPPLPETVRTILKVGGIVVTIMFLIMEERAADYWHHYNRRAKELETVLGFKIYSTRRKVRVLTATNASRALHVLLIAFWFSSLLIG